MGKHPFSGRYQGSGHAFQRAIGEHRFAYSAHTSATNMQPPPGAALADFPVEIGQAFENAFGRAGRNKRPSASEWISLLDSLEKSLVDCAADPSHQHVTGRPCPWCRMEQSSPGFIAFIPMVVAIHTDPGGCDPLAAILKAIRDPGPTPEIQTTIVVPTTLGHQRRHQRVNLYAKDKSVCRHRCVGRRSDFHILWRRRDATGPRVAGAGLVANIAVPKELKQLRGARSQADASWRSIEDAWRNSLVTRNFQNESPSKGTITALKDLPNEEKRQIHVLENNKRAAQLHRYLDRYLIANAKIKKIGSGRKAVLASFGIETAADVDRSKILAIQGFGPGLVAELMAWRQGLANKFVYNASEPINQSDLLALKARLATKKAELERAIRALATSLQQESASSLGTACEADYPSKSGVRGSETSEANEQAATGPLHKASKFIPSVARALLRSGCCVVAAP